MTTIPQIQLTPEEAAALRPKTRDLQLTVARHYASTMQSGDFGGGLRSFISIVQSLNDKLLQHVSDKDVYKQIIRTNAADGGELISALKYVRNVDEHLLYAVEPSKTGRIVGGTFGMRFFPIWSEIPADVHEKLHKKTQELRPAYVNVLQGQDIASTMMKTLQFFSRHVPDMIHRDKSGEWTGFPLSHQPGTRYPLHPEEPRDPEEVLAWLNERPPNGDYRLVIGTSKEGDGHYAYGMTFVGKLAFTPFLETPEQIKRDILMGMTYLVCSTVNHLEDCQSEFPDALQGAVWKATGEIGEYTVPLTDSHLSSEWATPGVIDFWDSLRLELAKQDFPEFHFELRRCRRLNALVPPSVSGA